MFQIGFGLLLYKILTYLAIFVFAGLVIPFVMNIFDGRGYGFNFKLFWGGIGKLFRLGTAKRD